MADIQAFNALRYELGKVGRLSDVVAPPYDVIDSSQQNQLYDLHENNVVRIILNRPEAGDGPLSVYERAAKFLKTWTQQGVLAQDNKSALYVYHQTFTFDDQTYTRRGFLTRVRLEPFDGGRIFPHEQTHSKAKKDRLNLIKACRTNTSPIFAIYPDAENEIQKIVQAAIADNTPVTATDENGVEHQMWVVTNPEAIAQAAELVGPLPLFIADGHHRYETALNFRQHLIETEGIDDDHPANYVMTMCVSMSDPGMIVLPTHRLFRGFPAISSGHLQTLLGENFDCQSAGNGAANADQVWEEIAVEDKQSTLGFYTAEDDSWTIARLTDAGRSRMSEVTPDQCQTWQSLGVSILHHLVIDHLLGQPDLPTPKYVHSTSEFTQSIQQGDTAGRDATGQSGTGGKFELGALVMPATLEHVRDISEQKERMPAKSTYFYPKLLSGLTFNLLG